MSNFNISPKIKFPDIGFIPYIEEEYTFEILKKSNCHVAERASKLITCLKQTALVKRAAIFEAEIAFSASCKKEAEQNGSKIFANVLFEPTKEDKSNMIAKNADERTSLQIFQHEVRRDDGLTNDAVDLDTLRYVGHFVQS